MVNSTDEKKLRFYDFFIKISILGTKMLSEVCKFFF